MRDISQCFRPLSGKWGYRLTIADIREALKNGFRPLSGKWGYRSCRRLRQRFAVGKGFRPLSGKWGYRSVKKSKAKNTLILVSVPSRGNGVIDLIPNFGCMRHGMFPSPLGEMGLSIGQAKQTRNYGRKRVSVPSRGNGVIDWFNGYCSYNNANGFPSPLGEMGLSITPRWQLQSRCHHSFRPLSGKWGYRSWANLGEIAERKRNWFPSPLGEMGLSIHVQFRGVTCTREVSVPSRGNGVIDVLNMRGDMRHSLGFRPLSGKWGYRFRRG